MPEALVANLPAHPGRFKPWIFANSCQNSIDDFPDTTGGNRAVRGPQPLTVLLHARWHVRSTAIRFAASSLGAALPCAVFFCGRHNSPGSVGQVSDYAYDLRTPNSRGDVDLPAGRTSHRDRGAVDSQWLPNVARVCQVSGIPAICQEHIGRAAAADHGKNERGL